MWGFGSLNFGFREATCVLSTDGICNEINDTIWTAAKTWWRLGMMRRGRVMYMLLIVMKLAQFVDV